MSSPVLFWFRKDLRLNDNTSLLQAYRFAQESQQPLVCFFVLCPEQLNRHEYSYSKVDLLLRSLASLKQDLSSLNIPLVLVSCELWSDIPSLVAEFASDLNACVCYANIEYELDESTRDLLVSSLLKFITDHDECAVAPGSVVTSKGKNYTVFTHFYSCWRSLALEVDTWPRISAISCNPFDLNKLKSKYVIESIPDSPSAINGYKVGVESGQDLVTLQQHIRANWPAEESFVVEKLVNFVKGPQISGYAKLRDIPNLDSTSKLSPYLAIGSISLRQCIKSLKDFHEFKSQTSEKSGPEVWLSELAWRDYYRHVMAQYPRVSMLLPIDPNLPMIKWTENPERLFEAWKLGMTGFPIVDASMRCLRQTGWLHNRLRMIVACFLSKILMVDWRLGATWFMRCLVDGDLGSNVGGWHWVTATGTRSSMPFFRIYNPLLQSKSHDPHGSFIIKYVPELKSLHGKKAIHDPSSFLSEREILSLGYLMPIVDYTKARAIALQEYKAVFGKSSLQSPQKRPYSK